MVVYLPRSAWTSAPKPDGLVRLDPGLVRGDAQHWPGGNVDFGGKTQAQIGSYLEGIRRFHTGTRGWTDIAYQQAIDPEGRIWELRGIEHKSAANGDTIPNALYGATLWLVGPNERPTQAQVTAYQTARQDRWLKRYPTATQVKRHSDVRPDGTACPGPYVGALVTTGTLAQPPSEDDMPLTDAEIATIATRILRTDKVEGGEKAGVAQPDVTLATAIGQIITKVNRLEAKVDADDPVILSAAQMDALAADLKAQIAPALVVSVTDALVTKVASEVIAQLRAHPLTPKA